jgi:hypothetical protein
MKLEIAGKERLQFQYLLPGQGNLKTLELVNSIVEKVKVKDAKEIDGNRKFVIDLSDDEIDFLNQNIKILDESNKLNFQSYSLIKKIINGGKK